jgi:hypothetical protein
MGQFKTVSGVRYYRPGISGPTFTTGQISKLCGVAARTVSKWIDSEKLKGYRIPGSDDRRVTGKNLLAFMRKAGYEIPEDFRVMVEGKLELLTHGFGGDEAAILWRTAAPGESFNNIDKMFDLGVYLANEHRSGVLVVGPRCPSEDATALADRLRGRWAVVQVRSADQRAAEGVEQSFEETAGPAIIQTVVFYLTHPVEEKSA